MPFWERIYGKREKEKDLRRQVLLGQKSRYQSDTNSIIWMGLVHVVLELFGGTLELVSQALEIFVINVGGYIGESTRSEIAYAESQGIAVTYLED